ncbi:uncharacterized protein [Lolium perenne]|uniref:uncharacterized protein isoform X8 n=1 Tax=Lolium perenne TaxID=4522 RepID=UPI003A9908C7
MPNERLPGSLPDDHLRARKARGTGAGQSYRANQYGTGLGLDLEPYSRAHPAPQRFDRQLTENASIVFPADQTDVDNEDPDTAATAPDLNVDNAIVGADTDPNAQVLENAAPLAAGCGKVKKSSTRKRTGTGTGATAAPPSKRPKPTGSKPPRRDKNIAPRNHLRPPGTTFNPTSMEHMLVIQELRCRHMLVRNSAMTQLRETTY